MPRAVTGAPEATRQPGDVLSGAGAGREPAAPDAVTSLLTKIDIVAVCGLGNGSIAAAVAGSPGSGLHGSTENSTVTVRTSATKGAAGSRSARQGTGWPTCQPRVDQPDSLEVGE